MELQFDAELPRLQTRALPAASAWIQPALVSPHHRPCLRPRVARRASPASPSSSSRVSSSSSSFSSCSSSSSAAEHSRCCRVCQSYLGGGGRGEALHLPLRGQRPVPLALEKRLDDLAIIFFINGCLRGSGEDPEEEQGFSRPQDRKRTRRTCRDAPSPNDHHSFSVAASFSPSTCSPSSSCGWARAADGEASGLASRRVWEEASASGDLRGGPAGCHSASAAHPEPSEDELLAVYSEGFSALFASAGPFSKHGEAEEECFSGQDKDRSLPCPRGLSALNACCFHRFFPSCQTRACASSPRWCSSSRCRVGEESKEGNASSYDAPEACTLVSLSSAVGCSCSSSSPFSLSPPCGSRALLLLHREFAKTPAGVLAWHRLQASLLRASQSLASFFSVLTEAFCLLQKSSSRHRWPPLVRAWLLPLSRCGPLPLERSEQRRKAKRERQTKREREKPDEEAKECGREGGACRVERDRTATPKEPMGGSMKARDSIWRHRSLSAFSWSRQGCTFADWVADALGPLAREVATNFHVVFQLQGLLQFLLPPFPERSRRVSFPPKSLPGRPPFRPSSPPPEVPTHVCSLAASSIGRASLAVSFSPGYTAQLEEVPNGLRSSLAAIREAACVGDAEAVAGATLSSLPFAASEAGAGLEPGLDAGLLPPTAVALLGWFFPEEEDKEKQLASGQMLQRATLLRLKFFIKRLRSALQAGRLREASRLARRAFHSCPSYGGELMHATALSLIAVQEGDPVHALRLLSFAFSRGSLLLSLSVSSAEASSGEKGETKEEDASRGAAGLRVTDGSFLSCLLSSIPLSREATQGLLGGRETRTQGAFFLSSDKDPVSPSALCLYVIGFLSLRIARLLISFPDLLSLLTCDPVDTLFSLYPPTASPVPLPGLRLPFFRCLRAPQAGDESGQEAENPGLRGSDSSVSSATPSGAGVSVSASVFSRAGEGRAKTEAEGSDEVSGVSAQSALGGAGARLRPAESPLSRRSLLSPPQRQTTRLPCAYSATGEEQAAVTTGASDRRGFGEPPTEGGATRGGLLWATSLSRFTEELGSTRTGEIVRPAKKKRVHGGNNFFGQPKERTSLRQSSCIPDSQKPFLLHDEGDQGHRRVFCSAVRKLSARRPLDADSSFSLDSVFDHGTLVSPSSSPCTPSLNSSLPVFFCHARSLYESRPSEERGAVVGVGYNSLQTSSLEAFLSHARKRMKRRRDEERGLMQRAAAEREDGRSRQSRGPRRSSDRLGEDSETDEGGSDQDEAWSSGKRQRQRARAVLLGAAWTAAKENARGNAEDWSKLMPSDKPSVFRAFGPETKESRAASSPSVSRSTSILGILASNLFLTLALRCCELLNLPRFVQASSSLLQDVADQQSLQASSRFPSFSSFCRSPSRTSTHAFSCRPSCPQGSSSLLLLCRQLHLKCLVACLVSAWRQSEREAEAARRRENRRDARRPSHREEDEEEEAYALSAPKQLLGLGSETDLLHEVLSLMSAFVQGSGRNRETPESPADCGPSEREEQGFFMQRSTFWAAVRSANLSDQEGWDVLALLCASLSADGEGDGEARDRESPVCVQQYRKAEAGMRRDFCALRRLLFQREAALKSRTSRGGSWNRQPGEAETVTDCGALTSDACREDERTARDKWKNGRDVDALAQEAAETVALEHQQGGREQGEEGDATVLSTGKRYPFRRCDVVQALHAQAAYRLSVMAGAASEIPLDSFLQNLPVSFFLSQTGAPRAMVASGGTLGLEEGRRSSAEGQGEAEEQTKHKWLLKEFILAADREAEAVFSAGLPASLSEYWGTGPDSSGFTAYEDERENIFTFLQDFPTLQQLLSLAGPKHGEDCEEEERDGARDELFIAADLRLLLILVHLRNLSPIRHLLLRLDDSVARLQAKRDMGRRGPAIASRGEICFVKGMTLAFLAGAEKRRMRERLDSENGAPGPSKKSKHLRQVWLPARTDKGEKHPNAEVRRTSLRPWSASPAVGSRRKLTLPFPLSGQPCAGNSVSFSPRGRGQCCGASEAKKRSLSAQTKGDGAHGSPASALSVVSSCVAASLSNTPKRLRRCLSPYHRQASLERNEERLEDEAETEGGAGTRQRATEEATSSQTRKTQKGTGCCQGDQAAALLACEDEAGAGKAEGETGEAPDGTETDQEGFFEMHARNQRDDRLRSVNATPAHPVGLSSTRDSDMFSPLSAASSASRASSLSSLARPRHLGSLAAGASQEAFWPLRGAQVKRAVGSGAAEERGDFSRWSSSSASWRDSEDSSCVAAWQEEGDERADTTKRGSGDLLGLGLSLLPRDPLCEARRLGERGTQAEQSVIRRETEMSLLLLHARLHLERALSIWITQGFSVGVFGGYQQRAWVKDAYCVLLAACGQERRLLEKLAEHGGAGSSFSSLGVRWVAKAMAGGTQTCEGNQPTGGCESHEGLEEKYKVKEVLAHQLERVKEHIFFYRTKLAEASDPHFQFSRVFRDQRAN
ncbi:hypothetical protein TGPRC2_295770 [Toxoplasma gondii TgCatPRC2]|uniref:Uncharacterized protein n=1 Tax=Toxoplasma gondii TgCatPRC2 TaxID=1130821 RepID=A0A151GZI9_TOXGO|nr:hypothetical protein TGPRC2_295770 [Toxoplasma gondii TgCatPRC2]